MLTVERFTFNPFGENTYVVYNHNLECIIIDPGCSNSQEQKQLADFIAGKNLNPLYIFLTHSHIDHVMGLNYVKKLYGVPVIGHELASKGLKTTDMVGKLYGIQVETPPDLDKTIGEGELLELGTESFQVLFCPGHAPDHLVIYHEDSGFAIVGDVIFQQSIGRTDLPGGDYDTLMHSIKEKVLLLPSETILYPGHGPETTIKEEIRFNPFLK